MIRNAIALPAFALLVSVSGTSARATTARLATHEELVKLAQVVVVGAAESRDSFWREGRIYTRYIVRVQEALKTKTPLPRLEDTTIEILTLGGVIGTIGQSVAGAARLLEGQRSVLYLIEDAQGAYHPVGMWQGVIFVSNEGDLERPNVQAGIVGPRVPPFPQHLSDLRRAIVENLDDQ